MYSEEIIKDCILQAEKFVLENDRKIYEKIFKSAEELISKAVIGGQVGLDLLINNKISKNSFVWDLYVYNPYEFAKNLTDELSNIQLQHTENNIVLKTKIKHKELEISINRPLFRIFALEKYKNLELYKIMPTKTGYYGNDIICMSWELQLINIYRILYSPMKCSEWSKYKEYEEKIIENNYKLNKIKVDKKTNISDFITKDYKNTLIKLLKKYIIIGDYANLDNNNSRLQFIVNIKDALKIIKDEFPLVSYTKFNIYNPMDFQLEKYTLYLNEKKTKVVDLYNCLDYELIPYVTINNLNYGNKWVLLRFICLDLWVLHLIESSGVGVDVKKRVNTLMEKISLLREKQEEESYNYKGIYLDENVVKASLIRDLDRIPDYSPND